MSKETKTLWGKYEVLLDEPGYAVKRLTVAPGEWLSLQLHNHRREVHTIVEGTGTFEVEGVKTDVRPGSYIYVPALATHRISNTGTDDLVIIEVWHAVGTGKLEESDIIRFEDKYHHIDPDTGDRTLKDEYK